MFARLTAKAILAAAAIAMAFFGIGLIGMAIAAALVSALGPVGGYAVAGIVSLVPPLVWAIVIHMSRPKQAPPPANNELTRALLRSFDFHLCPVRITVSLRCPLSKLRPCPPQTIAFLRASKS